ncbi:hypothetical protein RBWH47_03568 [Rhodopirellula baltica WH47]|uniref:Uncharacterized protein n=1 Tax=Rhodopirellula baltica WH47 TaxID=991778 RepID=F2AX35_RHOBT|nr:hypothetical protein RBWH47_03568 [Rhodopirellula baltica WH47]
MTTRHAVWCGKIHGELRERKGGQLEAVDEPPRICFEKKTR